MGASNGDTAEIIHDVDNTFTQENPRWVEWGLGRCGSLIALKKEPVEEEGRVKWFRKLVRAETCPPVLVWFLKCIDGYVLLDGHCRLKAFQLETLPVKFLVLNAVREEERISDPKVQKSILSGIEKRQNHPVKRKMNTEEINRLLINAFDATPYYRPITNAIARSNYEEKWTTEVRNLAAELDLNAKHIEDMIQRLEH